MIYTEDDASGLYVQVVPKESTHPISIDGRTIMEVGVGKKIGHGTRLKIGGYDLFVVIVDRLLLGLQQNTDFQSKTNHSDYSDPFFNFGKDVDPHATSM